MKKTIYSNLYTTTVVILLLAGINGCNNGVNASAVNASVLPRDCAMLLGTHAIRYNGSSYGTGTITLSSAATNPYALNVVVRLDPLKNSATPALPDPNSLENILLETSGTASCQDGTVRVRLGAAKIYTEKYSLLGGNLVGVFSPEVLAEPFGRWEMIVLDTQNDQQHALGGYWQLNDQKGNVKN